MVQALSPHTHSPHTTQYNRELIKSADILLLLLFAVKRTMEWMCYDAAMVSMCAFE